MAGDKDFKEVTFKPNYEEDENGETFKTNRSIKSKKSILNTETSEKKRLRIRGSQSLTFAVYNKFNKLNKRNKHVVIQKTLEEEKEEKKKMIKKGGVG